MKIRNLLEDIVCRKVDELFSDPGLIDSLDMCTCDQCRLDVVCYALNRLPPRYIVSGKGAAYAELEFSDDIQNVTDIVSIITDGIKKVRSLKRPACSRTRTQRVIDGPVFNFPGITGRIYHGETFEPLVNTDVYLLLNGEEVEMMNSNWTNPYSIAENTPGTYNFWPRELPAESDKARKFLFELRLAELDSSDDPYHFTIEIEAENQVKDVYDLESAFRVEDIYVFRR